MDRPTRITSGEAQRSATIPSHVLLHVLFAIRATPPYGERHGRGREQVAARGTSQILSRRIHGATGISRGSWIPFQQNCRSGRARVASKSNIRANQGDSQ